MDTITLIEPTITTAAVVVVDPVDDDVVHAHGGCAELGALVDSVERLTGVAVDDLDVFDEAVAELGLTLSLASAVGRRACPSCWAA